MDIEKLSTSFLKKYFSERELPAYKGWERLIPENRETSLQQEIPDTARKSSVALLLFPVERELHLTFIERAVDGHVHSGQIAFPGGKREPEDRDDLAAAVREMEEEIGVSVRREDLVAPLSRIFVPPSNFVIAPFLFFLKEKPQLISDEKEVASIFTAPLSALSFEKVCCDRVLWHDKNRDYLAPYWLLENRILWGATAMIASEFMMLFEGLSCSLDW